jgi:hypothetical protein
MNARLPAVLGLTCVIATAGHAQQTTPSQTRVLVAPTAEQEQPRPARAAPAQPAPVRAARGLSATVPADATVDSVAEDLQKIVVLCATEPSSEEFKMAWASYIESHGVTEAKLDALIDDVTTRAEAYRAERSSPRTSRVLVIMTTTKQMMHDTAMAVIRKIG